MGKAGRSSRLDGTALDLAEARGGVHGQLGVPMMRCEA